MNAGDDLIRSILDKDVQLQIHHGALRFYDSKKQLNPEEAQFLEKDEQVLGLILRRTHAGVAVSHSSSGRPRSEFLPLTFQQEFALSRRFSTFFGAFATRIRGCLNTEALSSSLRALVRRHESLRMRIVVDNRGPRQLVDDPESFNMQTMDCRDLREPHLSVELQMRIRAYMEGWLSVRSSSFDATLLTLSPRDHVLVVLWDHLFEDYVSSTIVFGELWTSYRAYHKRRPSLAATVTMQYADYALWQRRAYVSWCRKHSGYWRARLEGAPPIQVPGSDSLVSEPCGSGVIAIDFGVELSCALRHLARHERVPMATVILTLFSIMISTLCDQLDFVMPFVSMGRYRPEHLGVVGYLPHVLLLRIVLTKSATLSDLLKIVFEEMTSASENLEIGISLTEPHDGFLRSPRLQWFQTRPEPNAVMLPAASEQGGLGLAFEPFFIDAFSEFLESPWRQLPFAFAFWDTDDGVSGGGMYRSDLFSSAAMQEFVDNLRLVAAHAVRDPGVRLGSLQNAIMPPLAQPM